MKRGYWADHDYSRVSVEDIEEFVGWEYLQTLIKRADKTEYINRYHNERDKGLVSTLFLTGGRVTEALMLQKVNFDFETSEDFILVKGMRVLKRIRKVGEYEDEKGKKRWKTQKLTVKRGTFPIRRDEPLTQIMTSWVKDTEDYLFPGQSELRPYLTPTRVYQIVIELGVNLHTNPHWFRAQRASQLASEYGFGIHELMQFFLWKKAETAARYARLGWQDLADQMQPMRR